MNFHFISPREISFENWDWRNPRERGIGGSETSQVEMASRLAGRGHTVQSWSPCESPCEGMGNLTWRSVDLIEEQDFKAPGVWVIYRYPPLLDMFPCNHPGQQLWVVCQDNMYFTWTTERLEKVDKVVCLCRAQCDDFARRWPQLNGKIVQSSNGICSGEIRELLESEHGIERDPNKLIYASSPDRGLEYLLPVFERAREYNPDLSLEVAYGFDNLDVIAELNINNKGRVVTEKKRQLVTEMRRLGVAFGGRVSQPQLWRKYLSSSILCHPTTFRETGFIVCMEAQALGVIPITCPVWAAEENVRYGWLLPGDVREYPIVRARYVGETVKLSLSIDWQKQIRGEMMPWALKWFDWDNFVRQWEDLGEGVERPVQWYQGDTDTLL